MAGSSQFFDGGRTFGGVAVLAMLAFRFAKAATTAAEDYKWAPAGVGDFAIGISTASAEAGQEVNVAMGGEGEIEVDGTVNGGIAAGSRLKPDADGYGIRALDSDDAYAIALDPATTKGVRVRVLIFWTQGAKVGAKASASATDAALTVAEINGRAYTVLLSANGTAALAVPGAEEVCAGTRITVKKTGTAGAVTITPAKGTIAGGATHTALDAQSDIATFTAIGTDWVLTSSNIA